jgi:hypothetical protein
MQDEFGKLRTDLEDTRTDLKANIDRVYDLVDQHVKQQEIDEHERLAMSRQLDRQAGWIKQLAKTTDTKLVSEP